MGSPPVSNYYALNHRAILEMLDDYTHSGDPSLQHEEEVKQEV